MMFIAMPLLCLYVTMAILIMGDFDHAWWENILAGVLWPVLLLLCLIGLTWGVLAPSRHPIKPGIK